MTSRHHTHHTFVALGVPTKFRSDGGPQFASKDLADFMTRWGVQHFLSSPHFPQSNGHAESAVRAMKHLVSKRTHNGNLQDEAFDSALLEWRNTPNAAGVSPAQMLFGHPLRTLVPAHRRVFEPSWNQAAASLDREVAAQKAASEYDRSAHPLQPLADGCQVLVQNPRTKKWDQFGTTIRIGRTRSYHVRLPSGRVLWRNRRYRRPVPPPSASDLGQSPSSNNSSALLQTAEQTPGPSSDSSITVRPRSSRSSKQPQRLDL